MKKLELSGLACVFFISLYSSIASAENGALTIGVGTELKFPASSNGIAFSPCSDDPKSSCAVMDRATSAGFMKSRYICTFKVKNANIAKLDTASGGRALTVKKITKNDERKVVSVVLDGAKEPILLSCESEYSQVGTTNRMPNFPLTKDVLTGFKEFDLGGVNLEKESVLPQSPQPKVEPKNPGGVI